MGGESRGTDLEIGFVGRKEKMRRKDERRGEGNRPRNRFCRKKEKMRREEERGIDLCVMLCDVCVRWCVLEYGIL